MVTGLAQWSAILAFANAPVYFLVAFSLFRRNLWRPYLFFWLYLLVEGVAAVATLAAGNSVKTVITTYRIAQPIIWILYVLTVADLFRKVFIRFPGVSRFAQRLVVVTLLIGFIFSLASLGGDLSDGWANATSMQRYSVIQRMVSSALGIYLILIAGFLLWMPVPLPRNTVRHSILFFFYFLSVSALQYFVNATNAASIQAWLPTINLGFSLVTFIALFAWLLLLQPSGEVLPTLARPAPAPSPDLLLDRLESLNKALSRPHD